jgi:hypothetical protein
MGVYLMGVHLTACTSRACVMGMHLIGMHLIAVNIMGVHHRIQPFLLSRTCVLAAFGGPGLMPHFSFWR